MRRHYFLSCLFVATITIAVCQLPGLPKINTPKLPGIPGLDLLIKEEPPITTSLSDALTEIPYLDEFNPQALIRLSVLPRNTQGKFHAFPGDFMFEAQSYCLHAGTHGPGRGEGYLYAPLKGPKYGVIRTILQRSVEQHDLEQTKVQSLIWAILARTKPNQLSPVMRDTANKLLKPEELKTLEGSGWDYIKENSSGSSPFGSLPGPVRQMMEAENNLRNLFYQANAPFEELERVAVLTGDYKPRRGDREVPRGRWSYHPEGYFVRYFPHGYSHTTQNVYFPEAFEVVLDDKGGVSRIVDPAGRTLKLTGSEILFSDPKSELARAPFSVDRRASDKRRSDFESLLKKLKADAKESKKLAAIADVAEAFRGSGETSKCEAYDMAVHAWMATLASAVRPSTADLFAFLGDFANFETTYDPAGTVATPGETGRQRLAQSSRCRESSSGSNSEDSALQKAVVSAMKANGYPTTGNEHVYVYDQRDEGNMLRFVVRMRDGKPLPTKDCIDEAIAGGHVPPGSLQGANELLFGSVQFAGSLQRMGIRTVRVETGEITGAGKGDGPNYQTSSDNAFSNYQRW